MGMTMALNARLTMRQGQSLVLTPQLQQAIKLLQLSNLELDSYLDQECLANPLLERVEAPVLPERDSLLWQGATPPRGTGGSGDTDWMAGLAQEPPTLREHLRGQLGLAALPAERRLIALHLVDMIDEAGYLRVDLAELAAELGAPVAWLEEALAAIQACEPTGVGARDLAECLALQLRERKRDDPAMMAVLSRLELLAGGDHARLRRHVGVDEEDYLQMLTELRALEPKPGLRFGHEPVDIRVPDLILTRRPAGWHVEINRETLPAVRMNRAYRAELSQCVRQPADRVYLSGCATSANWLMRSLQQRIETMTRVAEAIVARQSAFFEHGVRHLRPLTLRDIAETIGVHESTVSRVTTRKYIATPRGVLDLKYFFTTAVSVMPDGASHSSAAVRFRIRELVEREQSTRILSDDQLVGLLRGDGIDIARRTVAKYRESMRIPSSVQRRREKNTIPA